MNIFNDDMHSIKPFLLDSILSWCGIHGYNPILVSSAHPHRQLPHCLIDVANNLLAFKVGDKSVHNRVITTEHVTFKTYFQGSVALEDVLLPVECWVSVRIKEAPYVFDLSFTENLSAPIENRDSIWPMGIPLLKNPLIEANTSYDKGLNIPSKIISAPTRIRKKAVLSLVWSDGHKVQKDQ